MFENIGWLLYAYTRLDALNVLLWFFLSTTSLATFVSALTSAVYHGMYGEQEKATAKMAKKLVKRGITCIVIFACILAVIPTKQDALLIYGVTTGVAVAEKTIEVANKSEIVGKVLQIVEAKIDKELSDIKKENK